MHRWKGEHRGENARFAPSIKLPEGLGEVYFPSLLGDGGTAPASAGKQRLPSLYGSPGAKPGKISPEGAV